MAIIGWITGLFRKKTKLHAHFIDESGQIFHKKVQYFNNYFSTKIKGEYQSYVVQGSAIVYDKKRFPHSFYSLGNPQPMVLRHNRNPDMDSVGFKNIIESKVIQDLFSDQSKITIMLLLIIAGVTLLMTLLIAAKVFNIIKSSGAA